MDVFDVFDPKIQIFKESDPPISTYFLTRIPKMTLFFRFCGRKQVKKTIFMKMGLFWRGFWQKMPFYPLRGPFFLKIMRFLKSSSNFTSICANPKFKKSGFYPQFLGGPILKDYLIFQMPRFSFFDTLVIVRAGKFFDF